MANTQEVKPLFIRRNQIKQITGLSQSTCWRLEHDPDSGFPRRRKVGGSVGWVYSELEAFIQGSQAVNS